MNRRMSLVNEGDLRTLFLEVLFWDRPDQDPLHIEVEGVTHELEQVAGYAGLRVWLCREVPDRRTQRLIDKELQRVSTERLLIFADDRLQEWRWLQSSDAEGAGQPRLVTHRHWVGSVNPALDQRLEMISVGITDNPSLIEMLRQMRRAFDAEQVTRRFYRDFIEKQRALSAATSGIDDEVKRDWYAATMMNRLMFVYFMQRKGFMDGDSDYLRTRLERLQVLAEERSRFYGFYRDFLVPLFHKGLGEKHPNYEDVTTKTLIGDVRYINGGIFSEHELEHAYDIDIPDAAFADVFDLFDGYQWHLDDREGANQNEINPDVLGYIFEQFINQKQMGAYYTKEDVTHFMTASTVLPVVLSRFEEAGLQPWSMMTENPDRYIWDGLAFGAEQAFPAEVEDERASVSRPAWSGIATEDVGLPGERWWEADYRRQQYEALRTSLASGDISSVDAAVSANIDLETLTIDVVDSVRDPQMIHTMWQILTSLRIVDPTCGSGAFLFAALKVLLPLYTAILEAAQSVDSSGNPALRDMLADVDSHPNTEYFLLKHSSLNNLYGVDIMKEAVEVARLRLFLKLVSAIDDKDKLEPLPDLDFNIKPGNILVGALSADEIEISTSSDLISGPSASSVAHSARKIADAFARYRAAQEEDDPDQDLHGMRADLLVLVDRERDAVNRQYYSSRERAASYEDWVSSHQPFHWFIEFPEVFDRGGFDAVCGNPPYVPLADIKDYTFSGFKTDQLPDIYAPCTERAAQIVNDRGRLSLIVPISCSFGDDFILLRKVLKERFARLWVSNFSRNPAALFDAGLGVRSTIIVGSVAAAERTVSVTKTHRWYEAFRPALFETLRYAELPTRVENRHGWVRIPSAGMGTLLQKLDDENSGSLAAMERARARNASIGFKGAALYWLSVFLDDPPAYTRDGKPVAQSNIKRMWVGDERAALLTLAVLSSKLAFIWWWSTGDDFNVTSGVLKKTPVDPGRLSYAAQEELVGAARDLVANLPSHLAFTPYAGKYMGNVVLSEMRDITDRVDRALAAEFKYLEQLPDLELAYACAYKPTGDRPGTLRRDPFGQPASGPEKALREFAAHFQQRTDSLSEADLALARDALVVELLAVLDDQECDWAKDFERVISESPFDATTSTAELVEVFTKMRTAK